MFNKLFGGNDEFSEFYNEDGSLRKDKIEDYKDYVRGNDNVGSHHKDWVEDMDARQARRKTVREMSDKELNDAIDEIIFGDFD